MIEIRYKGLNIHVKKRFSQKLVLENKIADLDALNECMNIYT